MGLGKGRNVQLPKRESKYAMHESTPAVRRWLTNLARGSPITAEVALRRLGRVCELLETTPQKLLEEAVELVTLIRRVSTMS